MNRKPQEASNLADEDWEIKKYRASAKYAELAPLEDDIALDESLGLAPISIRLQKYLVAKLKVMAREEGLGYQAYIRQILTRHAKSAPSAKEKKRARS
jgi:predicted DNA binding CopG/RHH family protein